MRKVLTTSISSKGQVVIPSEFRKTLGLTSGTTLAVFTDGASLFLKPVKIPKVEEFENLLKESRKAAKATGLKKSDLADAIREVRKKK